MLIVDNRNRKYCKFIFERISIDALPAIECVNQCITGAVKGITKYNIEQMWVKHQLYPLRLGKSS